MKAKILSKVLHMIMIKLIIVSGTAMTIEEEQQVYVFQPFPSLTLLTSDICDDGNASSLKYFIQNGLVYIAMTQPTCGLIIYDVTNLNSPQIAFQNKFNGGIVQGNTQDVSLSNDQSFLWVANSMGFVFTVDLTTTPFQLVSQFQSDGGVQVNSVVEMRNNYYILLCSQGFQVYYWLGKGSWTLKQKVAVNALNLYQMTFIQTYTYALVTASNLGITFFKVQESPNLVFTQSCVLKPYFFDVNFFQMIDNNTIAIMMQYKGIYMYDLTNYFKQSGNVCTLTIFKYITQTPSQGLGGRMTLSQDQKYLFAQFRSIGVNVYDVSQKSFNIVQNLFVDQNSKDIQLCQIPNGVDLLFYTNSASLQIFKRTTPNFNRDKPNLLLNEYQQVTYSDYKEDSNLGNLDYSCVYHEDDQNFFMSRAQYGTSLFKYRGSGILEYTSFINRTPSPYPTSHLDFFKDNIRAYSCKGAQGLTLMDFSIPETPIIVKSKITLNSPFVAFSQIAFKSDFSIGLVSNAINVLIIEIKDPLNPSIIAVIDTLSYLKNPSCTHSMFSNDEKLVFITCSFFGVLVVDISDLKHINFISNLYTETAYYLFQTQDLQYLVIGTGYQGVVIAEFDNEHQLRIISSVSIQGAAFQVMSMWDDNFILATSNENPSIQLINAIDKHNPSLIQKFGKQDAFGYYSMCLSKDSSYIFITSQFELLILQLQNQIILHTQVYELISKENSNEYTRNDLSKDQTLKIGQLIEMHLVPIYQSQEIQIKKAYYYENYILLDLPYWMSYSPSQRILSLTISKDSLQKDKDGNYIESVQQVVFVTYQCVSNDAFINSYLNVSLQDSVQIKQFCIDEGLLNKDGFVIDTYSPLKKFQLGANENIYLAKWIPTNTQKKVKNFIQYVLNQNIINYTTSFTISDSISVDLNNQKSPIFSLQTDLTLEMQVMESDSHIKINQNITLLDSSHFKLTEKAKFVTKNYSGILVLLSEKQNNIKLEGTLSNINNILSQGIKFSVDSSLVDDSIIYISLIISDGVNYNYEKIIQYKQLKFLSMQAPVLLSDSRSLNFDFQSKYPNGQIYIVDNFSYQVSQKVFTCVDQSDLLYSAQILINGQFQEIPKDFWLQYSQSERMFSGTPPPSEFQKQYHIQVNATDGYTTAKDTFTITADLIPFNYALQFAIQIFGPIFGLLGFWKYQHLMYNILFKKNYVYSKEIAYVGELYSKQIPSSNEHRDIAISLWKFFLSFFSQNKMQEYVQLEIQKLDSLTVTTIESYSRQSRGDHDDQKQKFQEVMLQKIYPYGISSKDLSHFNRKEKNIINNSQRFTQIQEIYKDIEMENTKINEHVCQDPESNQNSIHNSGIGYLTSGRQPSNSHPHNQGQINLQINNSIDQSSNMISNHQIYSSRPEIKSAQFNLTASVRQMNNSQQDQHKLNSPLTPSYNNNTKMNQSKMSRQSITKVKEARKIAKNISNKRNYEEQKMRNVIQHGNVKLFSPSNNKKIYDIELFTEQGQINFRDINQFIYDRQQELPEKKRLATELQLQELLNHQSMLFQGVSSLASEYLLSMNHLSKQLLDQLHLKATQFYREIDWYKAYLHIEPTFQNISQNLYPRISIDKITFHTALREVCEQINFHLKEENPSIVERKSNKDEQRNMLTAFSLEFIEQALKARALGFQINSSHILQKSCGETLHTYSHSIHSIKAFMKNFEIKSCFNLRKCLNLHYIEKGLTENDPLPSWIQSVDLIHGVILLGGTPEKKDVGSVIIKVYDEDSFIIRSYELKIIEKQCSRNDNNLEAYQSIENNILSNQRSTLAQSQAQKQILSSSSCIMNQSGNMQPENSNKRAVYQQKKNKSNFASDIRKQSYNKGSAQENQGELDIKQIQSNYCVENENSNTFTPPTYLLNNNSKNSSPNQILSEEIGITPMSPPPFQLDANEQGNACHTQKKDSIKELNEIQLTQAKQNSDQNQDMEAQQQKLPQTIKLEVNKHIQQNQSSENNYGKQQLNYESFSKDNQNNYSNIIEPSSVNTSFNPANYQQADVTARSFIQDNSFIGKDFRDISMNINITERYQSNAEKQEMKVGDSQQLEMSEFL